MHNMLCSKPSPSEAGVFGSCEAPLQVLNSVLETCNLLALFLLKMLKLLNEAEERLSLQFRSKIKYKERQNNNPNILEAYIFKTLLLWKACSFTFVRLKGKNWYKATKLIYYI